MQVLCPTCRHSVLLDADPLQHAIVCPACGASFRLENLTTPALSVVVGHEIGGSEDRAEAETLPPRDDSAAAAANDESMFYGSGRSQPDEPASGPSVPGYEILGELGRGGMGVVYKARQIGLERIVALKMILAGEHAGAQERGRFHAEAQAVARLQHPHIVQVFEVGECNGLPFLALEYCAGGSLKEKLAGTPLPATEAAALLEKLARAMHQAHAKNVIHRDLKPANVLLAEDGTPKITDFGLAKKVEEAGQTAGGAIMGTPSYMAPEQASDKSAQIGPAADIYALGAILYELLTGRPPFKAATPLDTILQVLWDDPAPPSRLNAKVPRDLETICLKCLNKEPAKRYAGADALADDLRRFLNNEPILARRSSVWERGIKWTKRRPAAAALIGLAAVVILGGMGGLLWYQQARLEWAAVEAERQAEETRRLADKERRHALAEKGVRDALAQANKTRGELHAQLKKPSGVFELLNKPATWEAMIETARAQWQGAKDIETRAEEKIDLALVAQINELEELLDVDTTDRQLALRLEKIREDRSVVVDGKFDLKRAAREYPEVFAEIGFKPEPGKEELIARRIEKSAIRDYLVAALDDWAFVASKQLRRQILEVARLADPDPWRDQLRDGRLWSDPKALDTLAEKALQEKQLDQLSPHMLVLVGSLLAGSADHAERWIRQAQLRYPADFWINLNLGNCLDKKNPVEAAGFFRVAVGLRPTSVAAWTNLGAALRDQKDAIAAYHKALEVDPELAGAWNNLGVALREQKDLPAAIAAFNKALEFEPKNAAAWNNLGVALHEQKDLPATIAAFYKALEFDRKYAQAWANLGYALQEQKDLPAAIAAYKKAVEFNPKNAKTWNNLGLILQEQKDLPGAIAAYHKALEFDRKYAQAWNNLGNALQEQKDLPAAIAAFNKALEFDRTYAQAWTNLGTALHHQKDLPAAIAAFKRAVEFDPKLAAAWYNLGAALQEQKDLPAAIAAFHKALEFDRKYAQAWNNLGNALQEQKDLPAAIAAYKKALECDAKDAFAWNNLGLALRAHKDLRAAIAAFHKALEINPKNAVAWNNLGLALRDQKDLPAAIAAYKKALECDPQYAAAWTNLGNALRAHNHLPAAIAAYEKALELDPKLVAAWYNLGNALWAQKDLAAAIAAYKQAIRLDPNLGFANANLGLVYRDLGRFAESVTALGKAAKLMPNHGGIQKDMRISEQLLAQDEHLAAIRQGRAKPKTPAEAVRLAHFAMQEFKKEYGLALRLFTEAFAADAKLIPLHRYHAACAAALTAAGKGTDAHKLDDNERVDLRHKALDWLRADLRAWPQSFQDNPTSAILLPDRLKHWQSDADLATVRDAKELAELPEQEQTAWAQLWVDVEALRKTARGSYTETTFKGNLTKDREQVHELKMTAGKTYVIDLTSPQFDTYLRLEDAKKKVLAENDDIEPGKNLNSRIIFTPKEDGVYRIIATSFEQGGVGAYTLVIREFQRKED